MKNRIQNTTLAVTLMLIGAFVSSAAADSARRPGLIKPKKELFKHEKHTKAFINMSIQCTDCHSFSIKPEVPGPLSTPVKEAYLRQTQGTCHQCHLGKVSVPLRKGCLLCHADLSVIKPQDHYSSWKTRHGKLAQMDQDACTNCHNPQDCTSCHAKQNTLNPLVHRPSFRLSHSIQARSEPQSCTICHKSAAFCMDCHSGRKK